MSKLIETLISELESQQLNGKSAVYISQDNLAFLDGHYDLIADQTKTVSVPTAENEKIIEPVITAETEVPKPDSQVTDQQSEFRKDIPEVIEQFSGNWQYIFNEGNNQAKLMFIADAERTETGGILESEDGMLKRMVNAMNFKLDEITVMNLLPEGSFERTADTDAFIKVEIEARIAEVKPEVIVLFGGVPLKQLMNQRGITKCRGQWLSYKGIDVMPTYHPAFLARQKEAKRDTWKDLQSVMAKFGKSANNT